MALDIGILEIDEELGQIEFPQPLDVTEVRALFSYLLSARNMTVKYTLSFDELVSPEEPGVKTLSTDIQGNFHMQRYSQPLEFDLRRTTLESPHTFSKLLYFNGQGSEDMKHRPELLKFSNDVSAAIAQYFKRLPSNTSTDPQE